MRSTVLVEFPPEHAYRTVTICHLPFVTLPSSFPSLLAPQTSPFLALEKTCQPRLSFFETGLLGKLPDPNSRSDFGCHPKLRPFSLSTATHTSLSPLSQAQLYLTITTCLFLRTLIASNHHVASNDVQESSAQQGFALCFAF